MKRIVLAGLLAWAFLGVGLSTASAQQWEITGGIEQYGRYHRSYDTWYAREPYLIAYSIQLGYKFYDIPELYYPSAYRVYPNILHSTTVYRQGPWPYYYGYNPYRVPDGTGFIPYGLPVERIENKPVEKK